MKICPGCQTRYTDDTLQFCLQDGSNLIFEGENPASAPTVAFNEESTVVRAKQVENLSAGEQNFGQPQNWQTGGEPEKSNTALIVLTTVLATVLIFGAFGVGAWFYFSNRNEAAEANVKKSFPDNSVKNADKNSAVFPPSNTDEKSNAKPTPTATPAPKFDAEQIKDEVAETVESLASLAESRELSAYMNHYADTVDYYNRKGASASAVRADKQRAFSIYDTIEMEISNLRVVPDASGDAATAVFDKQWYFENAQKTSEGKVQSELRFRKIGGAWKIVGERDLKVYYVN
jgi:ketosteroid isomerase-like protein